MRPQKLNLSAEAMEIHLALSEKIADKIEAAGGSIAFEGFMQMALYQPSLGYYQNNLHKFGKRGDFITAPEMGELFALGIANSFTSLSKDLTDNILELGAGSGAFSLSLLKHLEKLERLPKRYFVLEPSGALQSLQRQLFEKQKPELLEVVEWVAEIPDDFEGTIFGNEVMDAIPCQLIKKTSGEWIYQDVANSANPNNKAEEDEKFEWTDGEKVPSDYLPQVFVDLEAPDNYQTEIRPLLQPWIKGLESKIKRGVILLVDYGYPASEYYHPQRNQGTLRCFSRHLSHSNPLAIVGLQDITAHVDFSSLAQFAVDSGLCVGGFTNQAAFLLENDILNALEATNDAKRFALSQQVQKLTAPGQMGEVMKVIAFSKGGETGISGFSLQSQLRRL